MRVQNEDIKLIVVTGGPCGGKSTFMSIARQWLEDRGHRVVVVPEGATEVITAGFHTSRGWKKPEDFQYHLLSLQVEHENRYAQMLAEQVTTLEGDGFAMHRPARQLVLLCDRGALDSMAFVGRPAFLRMLDRSGYMLGELRARYDLVLHLVTAAHGAEEHYTLENNPARTETPEQARAVDDALWMAWQGHRHQIMVPNRLSFQDKVRDALAALARVIGTPEPLERERKFLVSGVVVPPDASLVKIEQTYLTSDPFVERRVRRREVDGIASFYYTEKKPAGYLGVRTEREVVISLGEYERLLAEEDANTIRIVKTRQLFRSGDHMMELDTYAAPYEGLQILEVELSDMRDPITLPQMVSCTEVTGVARYTNRSLAKQTSSLQELVAA